jgi:hypothetical protein
MTRESFVPVRRWSVDGPDGSEIRAINYHRRRPHAVLTVSSNGQARWWDFCWVPSWRQYFFSDGGGGHADRIAVKAFADPERIPGRIWVAKGIQILRHGRQRIKGSDILFGMGYKTLRKPLLLTAGKAGKRKSRNPFELGDEGECYYCHFCRTSVFNEDLCRHVEWCGRCGARVYVECRQLVGESRSSVCRCKSKRRLS